jgi:hypothetical protein
MRYGRRAIIPAARADPRHAPRGPFGARTASLILADAFSFVWRMPILRRELETALLGHSLATAFIAKQDIQLRDGRRICG